MAYEDKKPAIETVSREDRDAVTKTIENQFPFLCYQNPSNGFCRKKEMRNAYNGLVQAMDSLDNLRNKHRLIIENYSREKASCDSLLPKVITLEEILRGIGFPSGVHTSSTLCRKDFDASLSSFLPIYKKNERHYYALFGKRLIQHLIMI